MRWKWCKNSSYKQSVLELKNKSSYLLLITQCRDLLHLIFWLECSVGESPMRWKWWKNSSYKQSVLEMKNKSSYKIVLLKWAYLDHLQYPLFFNLTSHIKLQLKRIITSYSEHANITLRASISMLIHTQIIFIFKMKLFQINKHYIHRDIIQGQKCNLLNMNNLWLTMSTCDCI